MKKPLIVPPPPAGLDLGNLTALKVGDEVVTVSFDNDALSIGSVRYVHSFSDNEYSIRTRKSSKDYFTGAHKITGEGVKTMFCGDYWLSANPVHIAQSKAAAKAAKEAEEKKQAAFNKLLEQAKPIGELLGDGWRDGPNGGDEYYCTAIARGLAERLTAEQISVLSDWLKLS